MRNNDYEICPICDEVISESIENICYNCKKYGAKRLELISEMIEATA